jgi:hypothetical protein
LWITPGWTLFADVPIVLTATDPDGQTATTTLTCYSPTAATEVKLNHPQGSAGFGRDIGVGNDFLVVQAQISLFYTMSLMVKAGFTNKKYQVLVMVRMNHRFMLMGTILLLAKDIIIVTRGRVVILTKRGIKLSTIIHQSACRIIKQPFSSIWESTGYKQWLSRCRCQ